MMKAFLFDIGRVLLNFDFQRAAMQMQAHSPCSADVIWKQVESLHVPLETGLISTEAFVSQAMSAIEYRGTADQFAASFCDIFTRNDSMWQLVKRLRHQFPLYLFSNTSELHWQYLQAHFPEFAWFTDGVFSMRARAMKPDRAIYEAAHQLLAVPPEEVFYLDDLPANIAAGQAFGFQTHLYSATDHAQLLAALEVRGLSV